jgi:hypothetical protein
MNIKRNLLTSVLLSALIGVGAGVAGAADFSGLVKQGFFGSPAKSKPDTTIKIGGTTKYFSVNHFDTAKFENDKGQSFVWHFDTAMTTSSFPLRTIAPSGFDAGNVYVSVLHPGSHLAQ